MAFISPLPKSLQRYAGRIADYNDERASDNPIFIAYTPGWKSWTDPVGIQHSDAVMNVREAVTHVRWALKCDCTECTNIQRTGDHTK